MRGRSPWLAAALRCPILVTKHVAEEAIFASRSGLFGADGFAERAFVQTFRRIAQQGLSSTDGAEHGAVIVVHSNDLKPLMT